MKNAAFVLVSMMVVTLSAAVFAAAFKVYPGAKLEDIYELRQTETGNKMSKVPKVFIFTTNDFFENVVAFYRGNAREYRMSGTGEKPTKLPSGQELKEAYFILDGAGNLSSSKHWIKIQRPYLTRDRTREGSQGKYGAVREVTVIIEEDKRGYP